MSSSTDRPAGPILSGTESSISQAAGVIAAVAGSGLAGFGEAQNVDGHALANGQAGLPLSGQRMDRSAAAAAAAASNGAEDSLQRGNGGPSSSMQEDTSYLRDYSSSPSSSGYLSRQWGSDPSSSSRRDQPDSQQQPGWEPPSYRRSGLRVRSKRALQAAERMQLSGRSLIAEELQALLTPSTSSKSDDETDGHDEHLEAFIEQMLCPKTSSWKRTDAGPSSTADGREAVNPEILANIHTAPVEQVMQEQARLVGQRQLLAALVLLEEAAGAGRRDIMHNTQHKPFIQAAGKHSCRCSSRACVNATSTPSSCRMCPFCHQREVASSSLQRWLPGICCQMALLLAVCLQHEHSCSMLAHVPFTHCFCYQVCPVLLPGMPCVAEPSMC